MTSPRRTDPNQPHSARTDSDPSDVSAPRRERALGRHNLIAALADFAGPLDPDRDLEAEEDYRRRWLDALQPVDLNVLIDLLVHPPEPREVAPASMEFFELELGDALVAIGRKHPEPTLLRLAPLLAEVSCRPLVMEVLAELRLPVGLALLRPWATRLAVERNERARVAEALGKIGGSQARRLLEQMVDQAQGDVELAREIESALACTDE